jgi:hypothetical protein
VEPEVLGYWGNEEIINVSQTFRAGGPYQAARVVGADISYTPANHTGSGANVWGKLLPGGDFALGFVNNGDAAADVTCDAACFDVMFGSGSATATLEEGAQAEPAGELAAEAPARPAGLAARDLWAHASAGALAAPYTFSAKALAPHGGVAVYRFTPTTPTTSCSPPDEC